MESFYRKIFRKAWLTTWKYRWLWVFGFFATFLGNGTFYEAIVRSFSHLSEGKSIFFTLREYANSGIFSAFSWTKILDLWETDPSHVSASLIFMAIFMLFAAFLVIMSIVSQVAIIKSTISIDQHKKITKRKAFEIGILKFWPVFALNILTKIIMFGIVLLLAFLVSVLISQPLLSNFFLYIVAFFLLLIAGIIIYFLTVYATAFIVLRDKKVLVSLRYAWYIFRENVLLNLEVGFLLFLVNIAVGISAFIFGIFALSPLILLYLLMIMMSVSSGLWILIALATLTVIAIIVITGSWFTTFQMSVWALLFEELALKKGQSKLMRLISGKRKKKKAVKKVKETPKPVAKKKAVKKKPSIKKATPKKAPAKKKKVTKKKTTKKK